MAEAAAAAAVDRHDEAISILESSLSRLPELKLRLALVYRLSGQPELAAEISREIIKELQETEMSSRERNRQSAAVLIGGIRIEC